MKRSFCLEWSSLQTHNEWLKDWSIEYDDYRKFLDNSITFNNPKDWIYKPRHENSRCSIKCTDLAVLI